MKRLIPAFLFFFALHFLFPSSRTFSDESAVLLPTSLPLPANHIPEAVEVALAVNAPQVSVSAEGVFELLNRNGSDTFLRGSGLHEADVVPKEEGIAVNGKIYPTDQLVLRVSHGLIQVGKRQYRDQIRIVKNSDQSLTVVNRVDLEAYLKGVLPLEVHPRWPAEALKAHAVISRTFALFKSIEKQNQEFSVRDTVDSQVYGGALFHHEATDHAIDATRGEILTFQGNIFPAYFHANCGGRTTKPERIWPVHPNEVFKSISCPFCKDTKHWKWSFEMPLSEIEAVMQKKGYPAKNLKRVSFSGRDDSGRISQVTLDYKRSSVTISGVDFRAYLGHDKLKSLKAWVKVKKNSVHFRGFGWGHGIGFCQWGAKGQAEAGASYRGILKFYFPDAEIKRI